MENNQNIYLDQKYIPLLIDKISDENLKNYVAHELYTYAKRAIFYKKMFYIFTIATIICPAMVSVVNTFSDSPFTITKLIVTVVSAISAICAGILGVANIRQNWLTYRSNCELLKMETFKYVTKADPYNMEVESERDSLYIKNICTLFHEEGIEWKNNSSSSN